MALRIVVNGSSQEFGGLDDGVPLAQLVEAMALKPDRVAIERNGEIVARRRWAEVGIVTGDRLEIVHFVGGGTASVGFPVRSDDGEEILVKNCSAEGMLAAY